MKASRYFLVALFLLCFGSTVNAQVRWADPDGPKPVVCETNSFLCVDTASHQDYEGEYTGHDEPALLFYSHHRGSGNSSIYRLTLPKEPPLQPTQDGRGGVFSFQLRPAFWFGMVMCDSQSAPNFTDKCEPDTDENIFDNPDPASRDFIGHHPGNAFMEMQFYPPGWVGSPQLIDPTQYFAALNIDSLSVSQVTGQNNNRDCLRKVGLEPVNFAVITKNGVPLFPANPLGANFGVSNPDLNNVLVFNPGDELLVILRDTPAGFDVLIQDLTTGDSGKMVASPQSGFGQILFDPDPDPAHPTQSCAVQPYAFHPMYATSSEHTRTTWAAHSFNVAFSDEIGHFEFCDAADFRTFRCTVPGVDEPDGKLDVDDFPCITPAHPAFPPPPFQQIGGCLGSDVDFDGVPYKLSWAGTLSDRAADQQIHAEPIRFTSPLFFGRDGLENFSRVAFETDLPGIEANCNRRTGANCVNPPSGAAFYPIYTTRGGKRDDDEHEKTRVRNGNDDRHEDTCTWQLGGRFVPGTTNDFGGTSTAEYGDMLKLFFPFRGGSFTSIQDFRRIINHNPCVARLGDRFEDAIDQLVHVDD